MRAEIYSADDVPSRLRAEWLRLAGDDPVSAPEWRLAWWNAYGRGLQAAIGAVYQGESVVALAPWYLDRQPWFGRSLAAMGDGKACTDYQRILLDPSLDEPGRRSAIECLVDAYRHDPATARVSAWTLDGIEPSDASIAAAMKCLAGGGFDRIEEPLESSWVLSLPQSWSEFVAGTHRTVRRKINKALRRVEQGEVRFETATTWSAIDAAWDDFVRLHGLRFRDAEGGCFADPRFNAFLRSAVRSLAERGAAELVWCRAGNAIVSMQLYLLGGGKAAMYQSGIDSAQMQLEPGHLLYTHVVRRLIERGYERLDFLRGNEPYKADWGATPRPLARVTFVAPGVASRLRYGAWRRLRQWKHRFGAKPESPTHAAPPRAVQKETEAEPFHFQTSHS